MNCCPNCGGVNEDTPPGWEEPWWCWPCLSEKTGRALHKVIEGAENAP